MTHPARIQDLATRDLIERIGNELPADIRGEYYREMLYCRSLPEDDEMLRVLRALQYLHLLMVRVPEGVITEREKLEQLFGDAKQTLKDARESDEAYHRNLDQRLTRLPETVANGIKPEMIAAKINESLHQQFAASTIPQTARSLGAIANQIKNASTEFSATASAIGESYKGAAAEAREAVQNIDTTVSDAASSARRAIEALSVNFQRAFWWSICGLTAGALLAGILIGALFVSWISPPQERVIQRVIEVPVSQPANHAKQTKSKKP
jgi:Sec-independent protein translocase protein TatA